MTNDAPENPSTTPPVDPSHEEIENPASFEEQLAGLGEYLKQAALSALAAVAEGHPEQVLDLVENLTTSYEKIRYFKPLNDLIDKIRAENKEAFEANEKRLDERYEKVWKCAERELDFMKRAKDAGLSEEGCFKLLERSFAPMPEEIEDVHPTPLEAAVQAIQDFAVKYAAQAAQGGGGGCFGHTPRIPDELIDQLGQADLVEAAQAQASPAMKMCSTCEQKMRAAVDQFMATHPHMVHRGRGIARPVPGRGLDDIAPRSYGIDLDPQASAMKPPPGFETDLTRFGRDAGRLSELAHVAANYGVPSVPLGGAQLLERMGVHTGVRVEGARQQPDRGLDPVIDRSLAPSLPLDRVYAEQARVNHAQGAPSDLERFGSEDALAQVANLRRGVEGGKLTAQQVANAVLMAASVVFTHRIPSPAFYLLGDHRYADFVDVLLPGATATQAFRDEVVAAITKTILGGEEDDSTPPVQLLSEDDLAAVDRAMDRATDSH